MLNKLTNLLLAFVLLPLLGSGSAEAQTVPTVDLSTDQAVIGEMQKIVDAEREKLGLDNKGRSKLGDRDGCIERLKESARIIVPDSFLKLKDWDAGTTVAIADGANLKKGVVIRVAGDKVLVLEAVGKLKVYPKSACKPVPIVPDVKEGDRVKAPFVGVFKDANVSKVDAKIGRVFVKFDGQTDEKAIPFGDIVKNG